MGLSPQMAWIDMDNRKGTILNTGTFGDTLMILYGDHLIILKGDNFIILKTESIILPNSKCQISDFGMFQVGQTDTIQEISI